MESRCKYQGARGCPRDRKQAEYLIAPPSGVRVPFNRANRELSCGSDKQQLKEHKNQRHAAAHPALQRRGAVHRRRARTSATHTCYSQFVTSAERAAAQPVYFAVMLITIRCSIGAARIWPPPKAHAYHRPFIQSGFRKFRLQRSGSGDTIVPRNAIPRRYCSKGLGAKGGCQVK